MRLRNLMATLVRRWYLALACLLLTVTVGVVGAQQVPSTYQIGATVVLLPPTNPDVGGQNRLLDLGGLSQAVDVLIRSVSSRDVRAELEGDDPRAEYEITPDFTSDAPLLIVTVKGDQDSVEPLLRKVLQEIPKRLSSIQASVNTPSKYLIVALPFTRDKSPEGLAKPKLRTVAVLCVMTLAVGVLMVAALDGLLLRSKRRRESPRTKAKQTAPPPTDEPTPGRARPPRRAEASPRRVRPARPPRSTSVRSRPDDAPPGDEADDSDGSGRPGSSRRQTSTTRS